MVQDGCILSFWPRPRHLRWSAGDVAEHPYILPIGVQRVFGGL
jgi:hypothetical protein